MLPALTLLSVAALTLANPFHKYPYVFLLDVGNEELDKVNTEQIRISKQGGSLALRYPAIGNGEDIAHVRVSGIDFGTDLKANIVDGGPGYKYVVLVLIGNPGVAFDAVITVQTVPSDVNEVSLQTIDDSPDNTGYQVSEETDPNNSAEDLSDNTDSEKARQVSVVKENAELTQESSNVYHYAVNEALSGYGNSVHPNDDDEDETSDYDENQSANLENEEDDNSERQDIHVSYKENQAQSDETAAQLDDYTNDDDSSSLIGSKSIQEHSNDDYFSVIDDQNYPSEGGKNEQYEEYQDYKQNLYNEINYNPQGFISDDSGTVYIEEPGDSNGQGLERIFSDEYDDDDENTKYKKTNYNFIDRNDASAIAY